METARFLAKHSEDGYVDHPARGMRQEPEALTREQQTETTEVARRRQLDARIAAREVTIAEIQREIDYLDDRGRYLRRVMSRLKRAH